MGIGSVTAEPYFSGPQVALADLLSAKVPGQPGIGVGHDTLFPTTPTLGGGSTATVGDAPFWYGPTQIAVGTTGAATAINQWSDAAGEFVLAGPGYDVQPGDYLVINRRSTVVGDLNDAAVGTVSVVAAGLLTLTDIWNPRISDLKLNWTLPTGTSSPTPLFDREQSNYLRSLVQVP